MTGPIPLMANRRVVLSIGSNLGDRMANLQGAVDAMFDAPGMGFIAVSPVYETAPVGGPPQDPYLNAIVIAETFFAPETILERAQSAETAFHREHGERWGPRTLDVDIVVVGDLTSDDPLLTLPHPRAHERAFVLQPWHDSDAEAELPGRGPVAELLKSVGDQVVRRRDDLALQEPA